MLSDSAPAATRMVVVPSFIFDATPPSQTDTLSLHDALPISRRVRPYPAAAGPRAQPARARLVFGDVVGALQLQELARASQDAADDRGASGAGAGRECRGRRHRRRIVRGLQD